MHDTSLPDRPRVTACITAPAAQTKDGRAQTAIRAAVEIQKASHADPVKIILCVDEYMPKNAFEPSSDCDYAPDHHGITGSGDLEWDVSAVKGQARLYIHEGNRSIL